MTVGERIKERRIALNMTQDELAQKTGYKSRSSINKLESARTLPSKKIMKMAEALECRPGYLMGWTDDPADTEYKDLQQKIRIMAYAEHLIKAYMKSSPDTQAAVRAILHVEEDPDGDR